MKYLFLLTILISSLFSQEFNLRKYKNVENFYSSITQDIVNLSIKHKTPPAIILAIAGLESGYGSGYVSAITGNILSLGANKNDIQLPPLNIPYCKADKLKRVLFDPNEQKKCSELIWKNRPKSLKKDYRPKDIAGTNKNLEYFKYNKEEFKKAKLKSVDDFLTVWLNKNHKYKPFSQTKIWLDEKVSKEGINTLFSYETNVEFVNKIGGVKNSFNYRKTWPKKVEYILKNTGLISLCKDIYFKDKSFKIAWNQK